MSVPVHHVFRCVPRRGGGFLITTRNGPSAISETALEEGAAITITNGGEARRASLTAAGRPVSQNP